MVCPAADATEQGSEYGCSDQARSRTRPACRLFRTPPLRIYTMKPRCPTCGGLLRIHSHASTANTINQATKRNASQYLAAAQATPNNQQIGAFMVCPAADATEQGSEYGCSDQARSRTRPACRLLRTPPLRIHHEAKVPYMWWAAENTQPCVHSKNHQSGNQTERVSTPCRNSSHTKQPTNWCIHGLPCR